MNNHTHRSRRAWRRLAVLSLMIFAPFSMAQAASIAIDTLAVNSVSLTVAITGGGTYSFSGPVAPPAVVAMGMYQNPIVGGTDWKIYSTGLFGKPAPTGTVDGALGSINVDFSSLRGQIITAQFGMLDFALWPSANLSSSGSYNGTTGAFSLNWSGPFSISLTGLPLPITGTAAVTLGGTVTPVPLPATMWLLGSGLLGIAGWARRRKAA